MLDAYAYKADQSAQEMREESLHHRFELHALRKAACAMSSVLCFAMGVLLGLLCILAWEAGVFVLLVTERRFNNSVLDPPGSGFLIKRFRARPSTRLKPRQKMYCDLYCKQVCDTDYFRVLQV